MFTPGTRHRLQNFVTAKPDTDSSRYDPDYVRAVKSVQSAEGVVINIKGIAGGSFINSSGAPPPISASASASASASSPGTTPAPPSAPAVNLVKVSIEPLNEPLPDHCTVTVTPIATTR